MVVHSPPLTVNIQPQFDLPLAQRSKRLWGYGCTLICATQEETAEEIDPIALRERMPNAQVIGALREQLLDMPIEIAWLSGRGRNAPAPAPMARTLGRAAQKPSDLG
jgi:hypothetical protein